MTQEEYIGLKAQVDAVAVQDVHLGRVLSAIVAHLPGYSEAAQAKADADAAAAQEAAKAAEAEAQATPEAFPAPVESEQANAG